MIADQKIPGKICRNIASAPDPLDAVQPQRFQFKAQSAPITRIIQYVLTQGKAHALEHIPPSLLPIVSHFLYSTRSKMTGVRHRAR